MAAATPTPDTAAAAASGASTPALTDPLGNTDEPARPTLSSCPAGTVLNGLSYFKGKTVPVARADDEYPAWLWKCLEITVKKEETADADGGDEFCALSFLP